MISPARIAAFEILEAVSAGRADLPTAIAYTRSRLTDERDQALATEIATGVQRWRAALDRLIVSFSKRAIERLDPEVVGILRLSAYQLLYLTRVPASAVVDDAVQLTKRAGKRSAAGFVNAVLRAISRKRRDLPLPRRPTDPRDRDAVLEYLAVSLSHPRWLVERWLDRFGFETTERWLQFNNSPALLTLRANRLKLDRPALAERLHAAGIVASPGRFAPDALIVEQGQPLRETRLDAGSFVVQDEASQLVARLAGPAPGARVLDTCASPGGKTTALAAAMNDRGMLVACDVRDRRMALLRKTVAASGARCIRLVQADLLQPLPFRTTFDCVLVDAPCSGLGTLRRDPDIKWRRQAADLSGLAAAQRVMLAHAGERVARGGLLVYATCSSEPEENELVVDAFVTETGLFAPVDARSLGTIDPALIDRRGHLRTTPHQHGLEAFFGAVLQRRG